MVTEHDGVELRYGQEPWIIVPSPGALQLAVSPDLHLACGKSDVVPHSHLVRYDFQPVEPQQVHKGIIAPDAQGSANAGERSEPVHVQQPNVVQDVQVFTNAGERVNRPDFGSGVLQLVFAPNSPELAATLAERPDYVAAGPMFPTATKDAGPVAGPEYLGLALAQARLPVVAVGGITAENVGALVEAGARCVAVCSAVIAAEDPAAAARAIRARLPDTST